MKRKKTFQEDEYLHVAENKWNFTQIENTDRNWKAFNETGDIVKNTLPMCSI